MAAAGQALSRRQRLRRRRDFLRVQRTGQKHMMRHFLVFVAPPPAEGARAAEEAPTAAAAQAETDATVRLGITVTRRVGGAVVRNRIKRLVREAFRRQQGRFMHSCDMVWVAKQGTGAIGYADVVADMIALGERLASRSPRSPA